MRTRQANVIPTEAHEQRMLFTWAEMQKAKYPALDLMYHVPNEGKRSVYAGFNMRCEGLKSGVPDICIPVSNGKHNALYIEMKRCVRAKSRLSANQVQWIEKLNANGNLAVVCYGWEQATQIILDYLNGNI